MYTSVLSCIIKSLTIQKKSCLKGNSFDCGYIFNVDFYCGGRFRGGGFLFFIKKVFAKFLNRPWCHAVYFTGYAHIPG